MDQLCGENGKTAVNSSRTVGAYLTHWHMPRAPKRRADTSQAFAAKCLPLRQPRRWLPNFNHNSRPGRHSQCPHAQTAAKHCANLVDCGECANT
jgi:hypothetical protein